MEKDPEEPELKENKENQEPEVSVSDHTPTSEITQGYGCQVSNPPKPPEEEEDEGQLPSRASEPFTEDLQDQGLVTPERKDRVRKRDLADEISEYEVGPTKRRVVEWQTITTDSLGFQTVDPAEYIRAMTKVQ